MKTVNQTTHPNTESFLNETNARGIIMNDNNQTITCPHCDGHIDMTDLMRGQISKQFETEHQEALSAQAAEFEKRLKEQTIKQRDQAKEWKVSKEMEAKKRAEDEVSERIANLNAELADKNVKVQKLHSDIGDFEKLKRKHAEELAEAEAKAQRKLSKDLLDAEAKMQESNKVTIQASTTKLELELTALQKQLEDQTKLTTEMTRKLEQGSQQLQGEAQELAIENWLKNEYEFDTIKAIKPGDKGADVLQIINTREIADCGSIYYESKNTQAFNEKWIPKFQRDMLTNKSNVGIIVTRTMPSDMPRSGSRDGIWICSFEDFKAIVAIHRASIIQLKVQSMTQDNRNDKKDVLYDFVTSQEYQARVQSLVSTFIDMQSTLKKEQRTQAATWRIREKQIENIISSTTHMYGSIKGIAGNSVKQISELELPTEEELELLENESSNPLTSSTIN